jgi:hypothetical protein
MPIVNCCIGILERNMNTILTDRETALRTIMTIWTILSQSSLHPVHILAIAVMGLFKPKKPSQYPSTILWFFDQVSPLLCLEVKLMVDTRHSNSLHSPCSYSHSECPCRMVLHWCSRIFSHRYAPPVSSLCT